MERSTFPAKGTSFLFQLGQPVGTAACQRHLGTAFGQYEGKAFAQPGSGAGDQGNLTTQVRVEIGQVKILIAHRVSLLRGAVSTGFEPVRPLHEWPTSWSCGL